MLYYFHNMQLKMRSIWERYYEDANCVIFVLDSADIGRMNEAKLAYESVCNHSKLVNRPVFTFANKQDLKVKISHLIFSYALYFSFTTDIESVGILL